MMALFIILFYVVQIICLSPFSEVGALSTSRLGQRTLWSLGMSFFGQFIGAIC